MNKKLVLRGGDNKLRYCVLDGIIDFHKQLHEVYGIKIGHGFPVHLFDDCVEICDYYHAETMGTAAVVSFEDTDQEVCLKLVELQ